MKKKFNITLLLTAIISVGTFTSCDLELLPLNEVVLENFWENKSEVQNVVNSCYLGMQENGYLTKAIIWGECRSDNITAGEGVTGCSGLQQLLKGQLKPTNEICDWAPIYKQINFCNTVLYYAPGVAAEDPNYTVTDLHVTEAEVKALRAMSYFLLVKTFNNVPYTDQPSIDDKQDYLLPASPGDSIIDVLIADIEGCKDYAPLRYSDDYKKNTGRITRPAMYALLADLYLWRASEKDFAKQTEYYQRAVECCDQVIKFKLNEYDENNGQGHWRKQDFDKEVYKTFGYPLLAEEITPGTNDGGPRAYNSIFGDGNSFESLFELTYTAGSSDKDVKNSDVSKMYGGRTDGGGSGNAYVCASENMMPEKVDGKSYSQTNESAPFPVMTDYRSITNFMYSDGNKYQVLKYTLVNSTLGSGGTSGRVSANQWSAATSVSKRSDQENTQGWIMYRLTDVMLMRAEAEICLAGLISKDATPKQYTTTRKYGSTCFGSDSLLYDDAFNLISAVYMRSNPSAWNLTDAQLQRSKFDTYDEFIKLVELERRRELMFEGKRYFDLVRRARREGNTAHFTQAVSSKFGEASRAVLIKMSMMEFMYMPYLKDQIKINPYLKQNPAYAEEDEYLKN
ncbi:MAG: RagB/SusD family nutrient uptake outer membrane protein [Prevotellaceae bacterium]|nr:RagB/SusD family nutrient uptake outer membrane protein [Candidatus Colivivens equi]MCQ2076808.1 RagB/SusD family nutrient uptake outer membrane protein [Bacteroidaceae bacterium]